VNEASVVIVWRTCTHISLIPPGRVIQPLGVRLRGRPASAAGVTALSLAVPATMSSGLAASSQSTGFASIRLPP
jgi:hypothetical protein